ncbi:SH3 domain-containing protein [Cokeromyces recurvatus]|uniref:SH3 domain-containing protein n=1 Tax=Cokeromyces recurvatus TaxID=90255 RepID=UPI00221E74F6|nr:SH3 domain-containing protein [Cokeromyces recurvatus]KAI7901215.1 SH3 domain-containing protein [Cokeromyces recurvatus]
MSEKAFAEHILYSIRKELELLKTHHYIEPQTYNEILNMLPKDVNNMNRGYSTPAAKHSFSGTTMPSPTANDAISSNNGMPPPPSYEDSRNKLGTAEALYDYRGENPSTDLDLKQGDIIQLVEFVNNDWWKGTVNGKTGIFPSNYVKKIESPMNEKKSLNSTPPPPPPSERDSYGSYTSSPLPPKQDSYNYPPPPPQQYNSYTPPPPQATTYTPPPPPQATTYTPPPPQQMSYAPPPVQQVASTSSAPAAVEGQHESKFSTFGKKLAENVASSATWGFGATIGSNVANSIF